MIITLIDANNKSYLGEFDCQGLIPDKLDIINTGDGQFRVLERVIDYIGAALNVELHVVKSLNVKV